MQISATGERRQLVIFDRDPAETGLNVEERRKELAQLKIHPRERDANRAACAPNRSTSIFSGTRAKRCDG